METAKIFWSGGYQAVRLPKAFRFDGNTVAIRREGPAIILEPISNDWEWLADVTGAVDPDFATATEEQPAAVGASIDQLGNFEEIAVGIREID
ncbi:type II toxin-antitoxin system VapB family antitoxin [Rhizobium sp. NXC14]|uniref:antitoxin n=1 Tax=Rhizobium sp. NXC14 TaxID=1981173 RepID=UPI000A26A80B|nr:type II toxin-antitoxin system VapB family antitoxin [Rhizobium sp. NXC14]